MRKVESWFEKARGTNRKKPKMDKRNEGKGVGAWARWVVSRSAVCQCPQ